jgi:type IV pilus assembly protein PilO
MKTDKASPGALAPLLEKIEKLTRPQRIAAYSAVMVIVLGLSVYFLLWPKYQDIDHYSKELVSVQAELDKAKKNARELNDWRTQMKKKEAEYATVMRALPEKEEIPSLLAGISQAGKDAGLEFLLFQPKPESAKDFYAEIPVDITISGTYHQVAVFFDKVANLPRIVNVREIKMAPQSIQGAGSTLTTACQAVTYKFIETSEAKPGQPGQPKKP